MIFRMLKLFGKSLILTSPTKKDNTISLSVHLKHLTSNLVHQLAPSPQQPSIPQNRYKPQSNILIRTRTATLFVDRLRRHRRRQHIYISRHLIKLYQYHAMDHGSHTNSKPRIAQGETRAPTPPKHPAPAWCVGESGRSFDLKHVVVSRNLFEPATSSRKRK